MNQQQNNKDGINWTPLGDAPLIKSELSNNFKSLLKQASEGLIPLVLNFGTATYLALVCDVHDDYFTWVYAKEKGVLFKAANRYNELIQVIFAATDWTATSSMPITGIQALYALNNSNNERDYEHSEVDTADLLYLNEEVSLENYWDYFSDPPPAEEGYDNEEE